MTKEELQAQLDALQAKMTTELDAKTKKEVGEQIKALEDKLKADNTVKKDVDDIKKENETLKASVKKLEDDATKNQKAIDELIAKGNNIPGINGEATTFEEALGAGLRKFENHLQAFKEGNGKGFTVVVGRKGDPAVAKAVADAAKGVKAVGDVSVSNTVGTYFITPQIVPGITMLPYEEVHMRNILPVGNTNSNIIRYVRDLGGEGGPAMVDAGGTKPQIDRDLQIFDAPVRKIATWFRVPEEMIDDIPYLQSFLTQIGLEELAAVEDTQILYGSGAGQNLSGLFTNATGFNPGTSIVAGANEFDVIRAARKQLRVAKLGGPLVALISPTDFFNMTSRKDTTQNYLFLGGGNGIGLQNPSATPTGISAGGVQIEEHTAIVDGDFLVFQPRSAAIFDRSATAVRLYDQDQDNAIKNLITIVIEKRLALPIYRPAGFIKGKFANAMNDLITASPSD